MNADPAAWVLGASILSACFGFFGCALFSSKTIRESRDDAYWDGYAACNRDHEKDQPKI
jgi:hypothetical protein